MGGSPKGLALPAVVRKLGRYEIVRELGRGGMAVVHLARQVDLDREVALKELAAFHAADPVMAQRFVRESRMAASLAHPNIVPIYDFFEAEGTPCIAMEYQPRGSLRPYLKRLTLAQIAGVLEGVLAGLACAESAGIVHRDLKPENLLVASDGGIKIADFGIAKAQRLLDTGPALTLTDSTVGTPKYMAPEQGMGRDVGPWTDIYAVGVIVYEVLAGQLPFPVEETPMAALLHHINDPVPPLRSHDARIDPALADWVERLLVKDPSERVQSALGAWEALDEILIEMLGPRWRRKARLLSRAEIGETPDPLTPAPFETTHATPTPKPAQAAPAPADDAVGPPGEEIARDRGSSSLIGAPPDHDFITFEPRKKLPPAPASEPSDAQRPSRRPPRTAHPPRPLSPEPAAKQPERETPALAGEALAAGSDEGLAATIPPRAAPEGIPRAAGASAPAPLPRHGGRGRRVAVGVGVSLLLAVSGFLSAPSHSFRQTGRELPHSSSSAALTLAFPAGWRPLNRLPPVPGLELRDAVAVARAGSPGTAVLAGISDGGGRTLLPTRFRDRLGSEPRPDAVKLGRLQALRFKGLRVPGFAPSLRAYTVPTTAGVATMVCISAHTRAATVRSDCERVVETVGLRSAKPFPLGPSKGYAAELGRALGGLRTARRSGRSKLLAAKQPGRQAAAAALIGRAYLRTARAVARLEPGPAEHSANARIATAAMRAHSAYKRLASGARRRDPARYARAARQVRAREQRLQRALGGLRVLGYRVEAR